MVTEQLLMVIKQSIMVIEPYDVWNCYLWYIDLHHTIIINIIASKNSLNLVK